LPRKAVHRKKRTDTRGRNKRSQKRAIKKVGELRGRKELEKAGDVNGKGEKNARDLRRKARFLAKRRFGREDRLSIFEKEVRKEERSVIPARLWNSRRVPSLFIRWGGSIGMRGGRSQKKDPSRRIYSSLLRSSGMKKGPYFREGQNGGNISSETSGNVGEKGVEVGPMSNRMIPEEGKEKQPQILAEEDHKSAIERALRRQREVSAIGERSKFHAA